MDRTAPGQPVYNYTHDFHLAARIYGYSLIGLPTIFFPSNHRESIADEHISPGISTIYQAASENNLTSGNAFHMVSKGAGFWLRPKPLDMIRYFLGSYCFPLYEQFDESMISRLLSILNKSGVPNLLFVYFASSDGTAHWGGYKEQTRYLAEVVDKKLGRLMDALEKKADPASTLFILYSDHGNTEIPPRKDRCLTYDRVSRILQNIPGINAVSSHKSKGQDAVVILEGGMAGIYLKNSSMDGWRTPPGPEQSEQAAKAFLRAMGEELGSVIFRNSGSEKYQFLPGPNPMNISLEKTLEKINREYYHPCSPDVMIFSNYEKGYFFYHRPVKAIHGNINPGDFQIPLLLSGPGDTLKDIDRSVSIVDIAPTAAAAMGFEMKQTDGVPLLSK